MTDSAYRYLQPIARRREPVQELDLDDSDGISALYFTSPSTDPRSHNFAREQLPSPTATSKARQPCQASHPQRPSSLDDRESSVSVDDAGEGPSSHVRRTLWSRSVQDRASTGNLRASLTTDDEDDDAAFYSSGSRASTVDPREPTSDDDNHPVGTRGPRAYLEIPDLTEQGGLDVAANGGHVPLADGVGGPSLPANGGHTATLGGNVENDTTMNDRIRFLIKLISWIRNAVIMIFIMVMAIVLIAVILTLLCYFIHQNSNQSTENRTSSSQTVTLPSLYSKPQTNATYDLALETRFDFELHVNQELHAAVVQSLNKSSNSDMPRLSDLDAKLEECRLRNSQLAQHSSRAFPCALRAFSSNGPPTFEDLEILEGEVLQLHDLARANLHATSAALTWFNATSAAYSIAFQDAEAAYEAAKLSRWEEFIASNHPIPFAPQATLLHMTISGSRPPGLEPIDRRERARQHRDLIRDAVAERQKKWDLLKAHHHVRERFTAKVAEILDWIRQLKMEQKEPSWDDLDGDLRNSGGDGRQSIETFGKNWVFDNVVNFGVIGPQSKQNKGWVRFERRWARLHCA